MGDKHTVKPIVENKDQAINYSKSLLTAINCLKTRIEDLSDEWGISQDELLGWDTEADYEIVVKNIFFGDGSDKVLDFFGSDDGDGGIIFDIKIKFCKAYDTYIDSFKVSYWAKEQGLLELGEVLKNGFYGSEFHKCYKIHTHEG